jgi:nucleoside-diphosphate-sugar epimerase
MEINLVTGSRGFLCGHLCKRLTDCLDYGNVLDYYNVNHIGAVYHFAGPSDDYDFLDAEQTINTIVNGTLNMIKVAQENNAKFIFASSAGAENPNNVYTHAKKCMECYIQANCDNYVILRIPRVYDKSRKKGLMKKLRCNDVPTQHINRTVQYITLSSFMEQTLVASTLTNVIYNYTNLKSNSIKELRDMYT